MRRLFRVIYCIAILLAIGSIAGCAKKSSSSDGIPMPQSEKQISANTIEISFPPYGYNFSGGLERWIIQKVNSPDNLVFNVIYNDKPVASFPLGKVGSGTYKISGTINIDGVVYKGVSITLKKDIDTGSIKLEKVN